MRLLIPTSFSTFFDRGSRITEVFVRSSPRSACLRIYDCAADVARGHADQRHAKNEISDSVTSPVTDQKGGPAIDNSSSDKDRLESEGAAGA